MSQSQSAEISTLLTEYQSHFNAFVVYRLFAGMYQNAPASEYSAAVESMLALFKERMTLVVGLRIQQLSANASPTEAATKFRKLKMDHEQALSTFIEVARVQLMELDCSRPPDAYAAPAPPKEP